MVRPVVLPAFVASAVTDLRFSLLLFVEELGCLALKYKLDGMLVFVKLFVDGLEV
jgi:hypothetical protein